MEQSAVSETYENRKPISGSILKYVACLSMLVDHFFVVLYPVCLEAYNPASDATDTLLYQIGRAVGRLAFVLYAFLLTEGFVHTHSRGRYLLRLGILALLSEIPFDLAVNGSIIDPVGQNVYFTLFFGILALWLWEKLSGKIVLQIIGALLCCAAAFVLATDYSFMGVLLILVLYVSRGDFKRQFISGAVTLYLGMVLLYIVNYWGSGLSLAVYFEAALSELYGLLAFILIYFYNGRRGKQPPKPVFYLFYPVHLLLLYGLTFLF